MTINNNLYKSLGVVLMALLVTTSGCKKSFLDVPPQAQQEAAQFWKTPEDATKGVNSMYANLRTWENTAFAPMGVESLGSDESEKGSTAGDATFFNAFDDFSLSSTEGQVKDFWKGQFQNINLANQVLDNIPNINMDATLRTRYMAEAKFIRAYSYFRLVRAFGAVPLRLSVPKDASEYNLPRTPAEQIWAAIEKDLTEASTVLPSTYGPTDIGRATKGAAIGLHAKVALYQKKWSDVLSLTNTVMTMGYSLFPNYEGLFRVPNENNSESIFEIQSQKIPSIAGATTSQYSQIQGVKGASWGGWGFNTPTQTLADAFEPGDPRKDATILFAGETTPQGDVVPDIAGNPRMYNQKAYVPSTYWVSGFNEGADQNIRVLRYADILLMNAEAANELGNSSQALASLELVRKRARQGSNSILPAVTTTDQTALRNAIYHERQVELAMENDRFFDVIRQGRGAAVFGPKGFKANKNELMPIPSDEIDLSAGVLTQNPHYN
jgi:hypothetical protein